MSPLHCTNFLASSPDSITPTSGCQFVSPLTSDSCSAPGASALPVPLALLPAYRESGIFCLSQTELKPCILNSKFLVVCIIQSSPEILVLLLSSLLLPFPFLKVVLQLMFHITQPCFGHCLLWQEQDFVLVVFGMSLPGQSQVHPPIALPSSAQFHLHVCSSCTLLSSSVLMVWDLWLGIIFIGTNNFLYNYACFIVLHSTRLWQVGWSASCSLFWHCNLSGNPLTMRVCPYWRAWFEGEMLWIHGWTSSSESLF